MQAALFLLLGPLAGIAISPVAAAATIVALTLVAIGLSALGLLLAWSMDSTQGFHAIMNLLLMPMWLLSGAFFPASGASTWMTWIMAINPLTYGVTCVRYTLALGSANETPIQTLGLPVLLTLIFAAVMLAFCTKAVDRHE
jgi:ABC-2 type transport system permease protein